MSKKKLGDQVKKTYDLLLEMIITLKLKPGEVIVEKEIEKQTGMGRTPIREALLLLKQDHFVEREPHKSTYIKEVGLNDIKELFEALFITETNLNLIAMKRATPAELEDIEEACNRVDTAIAIQDPCKISSENIYFHNFIYQTVKNKYLFFPAQRIRKHAERLSHLTFRSGENSRDSDIELHNKTVSMQHKEIVRCLKKKDPKGLKLATIEHIEFFREAVLSYLQDSHSPAIPYCLINNEGS